MPRRDLGPCGERRMLSNAPRAFEGESSGQDGVVMVTAKGGEAAVADAAASSGIRAPNKKSPLPRAGSGHAHIVSSFPAGGIPVSGYTLSARFPWASPLGNANSEVFRILFFSRRTLPETTGLCQALCSQRNVRVSCFFLRFCGVPPTGRGGRPSGAFRKRVKPYLRFGSTTKVLFSAG